MNDTICAISTSLGIGAISIIRISGEESIKIVNKITKRKELTKKESHTITYDYIVDKTDIIDEVLITVMKKPKTFTKEDVVEINCHGGISTTNKILELLLNNECRLAEPGEFSKRAFLNGRIDLIEAEGIMDLISSKTDKMRTLAISQMNGTVSNLIKNLRQNILEILANIEVNIDYPEYEDIEIVTNQMIYEKMNFIEQEITKILSKSENCRIIKEGINVAIVGRPNVGKSSLLNCLLETNKAIVTDIAGTTRDCVEGTLNLDGILVNLIDTAGIRETEDIVEKIGVDKSKEIIKKANLVILILNNNEKLTEDDKIILDKIKEGPHIIVINKIDLEKKIIIEKSEKNIFISVTNNEGIDELKNKIKAMFNLENIETDDLTYLSNARTISLLKQGLISVQDVNFGLKENLPIDILEIDLKSIWTILGSIIGENYDEELIDQLFSQFCLGK